MSCNLVVEKIDDYFDGQLDLIEQERFKTHLLECNSCQMLVEDYQMIKELMTDMPIMPLPSDFSQTLHSKLVIAAESLIAEKSDAERLSTNNVIPFPRYAKKLMPYVAAAAVLLIIVTSGKQIKESLWFNHQVVEQASNKIEVKPPLIAAAAPIVEVATVTKAETEVVKKSATEMPTIVKKTDAKLTLKTTNIEKTTLPKKSLVKATSQVALLDSTVGTMSDGAPTQTPPLANSKRSLSSPMTVQATNEPAKNEDLNLKIVSYQVFYQSIEDLMNQIGGNIESSFSELLPADTKDVAISTQLKGYVIINVPSAKVETVLEEIEKMGTVQPKQVSNVSDAEQTPLGIQDKSENLTTLYIGVEEVSKTAN